MTSSGSGGRSKPVDPMIGQVVLGRYEILRRIGSGGMGAVYAAKQLTIDREVAVKVLRGDLMSNEHIRERFRREAEIIGKLRHPNTIQLIDYGETEDGLALMVMELLVGTPLDERLKESGPMSIAEAIQIGIDVSSSLAEAHEAGLVHRDLKPGNIFLVDVGGQMHAKVLDFGIARILDEEATRITSTGQVFGTPRYMSPEQGMATGEVDGRSDLYSLGLIIYECMVGQPPFVAKTSIQYLSAHATMPPPKLSENIDVQIPFELEQLVDACLVKQADYRIQHARDVVEALKRISTGVSEKHRQERGQVPALGHSAIADLLPQTEAPATVPAHFAAMGAIPGISTEAPSTVIVEPKAKSGLVVAVVFGILLLAGLATAAIWSKSNGDVSSTALSQDQAPVAVSVNTKVSPTTKSPSTVVPTDAGLAAVADGTKDKEKASSNSAVRAETKSAPALKQKRKKRKSKSTRRDKKKPAGDEHALPGFGGISGPRGLMIPVDDEENPDLAAAKACKKSILSAGSAELKVTGCKKGCAVLLDGDCAGQTPLSQSRFKKGNLSLTVVCGKKTVLDKIVRLRPGKPVSASCR